MSPSISKVKKPLTIAWISDFPVEWLPELPPPLQGSPRRHPATWQIVLLSEFEKNADLKVHVILLRQKIQADFSFERNGVVFHVLKSSAWLRPASLFWADTMLIRRLCKTIKPDLIHAWGIEKGAGLIASRLGYPYLVTVQGLFVWYKHRVPLPVYFRFIEQLERFSLPRAPLVTTESAFAVSFLQQRFPGLCVHQAEHAPNEAFFHVVRRPQTTPLHLVAIGELSFRKGTDLLLQGLDRLRSTMPFKLTIVSGPDTAYLNSMRSQLPAALWERVEFRHHILPDQVAELLQSPTIMLLPTRADVSPNAVKEAVVAGVPVVASEVGGIPDYVRSGENGILFSPDDLDAFLRAVQEAAQHPLFGRGQVKPASLDSSRAYLSPSRMAENFLAAYKRAFETARIAI